MVGRACNLSSMTGTVRRQSGVAASPEGRVRIAMTTPSQERSTAVLDVRGLYLGLLR